MKLFIKLLAALVALLILAVAILVTVVDPNDYKETIQAQVKKAINRDLLINGDISWTFFPQLGFSSGEIELNNLAGFNRKHLLKIDHAAIGLAVLPLFKGEIQIGELTLDGLLFNLITRKDGTTNLDNMFPEKTAAAPELTEEKPPETEKSRSFDAAKLQLAGVNIENAQIEVQDLKAGSTSKVDIDHIRLGKFVAGEETDLSVLTDLLVAQLDGHIDLQTKLIVAPDFSSLQLNDLELQTVFTGEDLAKGKISSTINTDIAYDLANSKAELNDFNLQVGEINLKGNLSVQTGEKTKVRFALQGNTWDLNPYLPQTAEKTESEATAAKQTEETKQPGVAEQEPDLSFLRGMDVMGTLALDGLKASGLTIGKIDSTIEIAQGRAQIKPLTAELYQGLLTVNGWVDDAKGANKYKLESKLNEVQIKPLLIDAAKLELLSGTTAFNFSATGSGLTESKIKSGLLGNGSFKLVDGELYGINIPQEIRSLKAKLKGDPAPTQANIKKTDFASLTGDFSIKDALVDNNKLLMLSPVMRLDGIGLIDIFKGALDYKLSVTPLSKSDEKTELQDLGGITIPLLIKGPFSKPKFSLDTEGALEQHLKEKADAELEKQKQKLEEKKQQLQEKSQQKIDEKSEELEDKLKQKLGDLFG